MATSVIRGSAAAAKACFRSPRRSFASAARDEDAYEAEKWEKITYAGIASCTALAIYVFSKGHPQHEEPKTMYPYMRVRNKDFPWGPDSLFETIKKKRSTQ